MTFWLYHVLVSAFMGLILGLCVCLMDLDHGLTVANLRCALSLKVEDCVGVGLRGVFHSRFLWVCFLGVFLIYTAHLVMDGEL